MAKQKINEYVSGVEETSYIVDFDEKDEEFKRVCIFYDNPNDDTLKYLAQLNKEQSKNLIIEENNEFFVNTEDIDTAIKQEQIINGFLEPMAREFSDKKQLVDLKSKLLQESLEGADNATKKNSK